MQTPNITHLYVHTHACAHTHMRKREGYTDTSIRAHTFTHIQGEIITHTQSTHIHQLREGGEREINRCTKRKEDGSGLLLMRGGG